MKHSLWKSVNAAFAALALLGGLTACGGGGGDTNTEPTVVPVSADTPTDTPSTALPATVGAVASTGALSRLGDFFSSLGWQNSVIVTGKMQ